MTQTTATQRRIQQLIGRDRDLPTYPVVKACTRFLVTAPGAYNMSAPADDLHEALELAWTGYKMGESPAYVWDLRGDTAEFDATAEPRIIAVVGVFYIDEED